MSRDHQPYLVPLSFGYDGSTIYLHTAVSGKKIDFMEANPNVCFEFEHKVALVANAQTACKWSFSFESVIGEGTVSEVVDTHQKNAGLAQIMRHYSGHHWELNPKAVARTRVWKIDIRSLTGKRSLQ